MSSLLKLTYRSSFFLKPLTNRGHFHSQRFYPIGLTASSNVISWGQIHGDSFQRRLNSNDVKPPLLKKENIYTVPNFLCLARIASAPCLAHLICHTQNYTTALALFGFAGITDALDGWIARNFKGQASMLGSFLDPLADKIFVATLFLSLTYVQLIPIALTSLVVSRDVLLVYAGLYIRYLGVTPPFTMKKYFDVSAPTAQVKPTGISKINTGFQLSVAATALALPVFDLVGHPAFTALCFVTAGTTFASAVSYAFQRNTYQFSSKAYDHQFGKKLTAFVFFVVFNSGFALYSYRSDKRVESSVISNITN